MEKIADIKQRMYAMRNGIVADALRRGGSPYRLILGLNLPQISEIAKEIGPSAELAEKLRSESGSRECQMLATMLYPVDGLTEDSAVKWVAAVEAPEVADVLCMKLLRHVPFMDSLIDRLMESDRDMERYTALRLLFYTLPGGVRRCKAAACGELSRGNPLTLSIARSLLNEIALQEE